LAQAFDIRTFKALDVFSSPSLKSLHGTAEPMDRGLPTAPA